MGGGRAECWLPQAPPHRPAVGSGLVPLHRPHCCRGSLCPWLRLPLSFEDGQRQRCPKLKFPLCFAVPYLCPSFANSPFIKIPPVIFLSMPSVSCWDPD